ncbi:MAG: ABC transporter permease [Ignavibacteriales bacterium]|nr:ABC transporter permease [Ignavibacteriales bacterium]
MNFPFFIANRFSLSKKNSRFLSLIGIITIVGIAIGVATLILTLTVLSGFKETISRKIIQLNSHIQITSFNNRVLPDYKIIRPALENKLKPYVEGISPFASNLAIIKSKRTTDGIIIKGILPEYDVSNLKSYITDGRLDLTYQKFQPSILIGKKLAEKLQTRCGDLLTTFTIKNNSIPSPENPPGIKQFRVAAIFESGMAEYDDQFAYTNLLTAQEIFGMTNSVNGYDIKLNNITKIDSLANNLGDYLGYPYYVRTIFKVYQNIFTWIDLQKRLIPIALILIVIVAVFNIVGTLLMIVLERANAIGILKSMGAKNNQVISVFLLQGIYLSIIGIVLGNLIALILSKLQQEFNIIKIPETVYFMSQAPVVIEWQSYLIISVATLILCILASIIPSYIGSKFSPISTLRFN